MSYIFIYLSGMFGVLGATVAGLTYCIISDNKRADNKSLIELIVNIGPFVAVTWPFSLPGIAIGTVYTKLTN